LIAVRQLVPVNPASFVAFWIWVDGVPTLTVWRLIGHCLMIKDGCNVVNLVWRLTKMSEYITAIEAAEILNVSVIWFLENVAPNIDRNMCYGSTTYNKRSVIAWKHTNDRLRDAALDELTGIWQEMGW
jgi:hypothetical protein